MACFRKFLKPLMIVLVGLLVQGATLATRGQTPPAYVAHLNVQPTDVGGELRLSATFASSTAMTFRWRKNGVVVAQTGPDAGTPGTTTYRVEAVQAADAGTYVVEATNATGTAGGPLMPVVVTPARPPVFVVQSGDLRGTLVDSLNVAVAGSPPFNFRWLRNGVEVSNGVRLANVFDGGLSLASLPGGREGSYVVEVSNRFGKIVSRTIQVLPPAAAGSSYIYRQPSSRGLTYGESASLEVGFSDAADIRSRQWRRNGVALPGADGGTHFFTFEPALAGRYSLVITMVTGQTFTSDEAEVSLVGAATPLPLFALQPQSQAVRSGECVTLTAETERGSNYQWFKDGAALAGATGSALFLPNVSAADAGRYRMDASNGSAKTSSTEAVLTVTAEASVPLAPLILAGPPSELRLTTGLPASLTVRATGNPAPSIQWFRNNVPIPGATAATYQIPVALSADVGTYWAVATNAAGSVGTSPAVLTITTPSARPAFLAAAAPEISAGVGRARTIRFLCAATPSPQFQWFKDGTPISSRRISGGTDSVTNLPVTSLSFGANDEEGVLPSDAGIYTVVATNAFGTATSDAVKLTVRPPPVTGIYMQPMPTLATFSSPGIGAVYVGPDRQAVALMLSVGSSYNYVSTDMTIAADGTLVGRLPRPVQQAIGRTEINGYFRADSVHLPGFGGYPARDHPFASAQGAFGDYAGYWRATLAGPSSGTAHAIVSARGEVVIMFEFVTALATRTHGVQMRLGADGTLHIDDRNLLLSTLDVRFDAIRGTFSGSGAVPSVFASATFAGTRIGGPLPNRLANIATRGLAGSDGATMIAGFAVTGSASRSILIRAVGPSLANFGLPGALADSRLELFRNGGKIADNDNWGASADASAIVQAATRTGAFALAAGSKDAVLLPTLEPGSYSAQVGGGGTAAGASGVALVEVYDAGDNSAPNTAPRLTNISTRGSVGRDENVLIAGIVVTGIAPKRLLIRAVGPGLTAFGVPGGLADPFLRLYSGNTVIEENDNWSSTAELTLITTRVGAFALNAGSKDALLLVTLPPGTYTAQVSGVNDTTGVALVEVYEISDPP